jgi:hypothetical protein
VLFSTQITRQLTGIDQVTILLLQSLPGLLLGTSSLSNDELDIVLLDLAITGSLGLVVGSLQFGCANCQLLSCLHQPNPLVTTLHQVLEGLGDTVLESTGGVSLLGSLGAGSELSLGAELSGRVGVLGGRFSKDNVGVGSWRLVDFRVGDNEQDTLGSSDSDSLDTGDLLEA